MYSTARKVGRITVAVGLVALGGALLMDNLLAIGPSYTNLALRFWPILLIGFGLEYLLFSLPGGSEHGHPVRLRFDLGGATLLFLVLGLTAGFQTLAGWISLDPRDYVISTGGRGGSETVSVPADEAKAVDIEIDLGRVELFAEELRAVRVEASYDQRGLILRERADLAGAFGLTARVEGGTIRIRGKAPDGFVLGSITATYRVYIPAGMAVHLRTGAGSIAVHNYAGELHLSTKVGSISVAGSSGRLHLESGSGSIDVTEFNGPVVARTAVGRIDISRVNGALHLDSGTGSIRVDAWGGGEVVAETRTGSVTLSARPPLEGDVLLRTTTGSITLTLPADASMKVSARTGTGSITAPPFVSVSRHGASQTGVGSSGTGRHAVTLETGMGSIRFDLR